MIENQSVSSDCPLRHTARITLVLSNRCPYVHIHPKCPASRFGDLEILPTGVILDVLETAAGWGWGETGTLAWHCYNEPTCDPRLVWLCRQAKAMMPRLQIHLWTNGWYLDDGMAADYSQAGVTKLVVSTYSQAELDRLVPLKRRAFDPPMVVKVWRKPLDDRLAEHGPDERGRPCHAPLYDLTIYPSGDVGLCCMDTAYAQRFGGLKGHGFAWLMERIFPAMRDAERELERGERRLPVCSRCRARRGKFGYAAERAKTALDSLASSNNTGMEG